MKLRKFAFSLPQGTTLKDVVSVLGSIYQVREENSPALREQYLDTFDWRLYREGFLLCRNTTHYALTTMSGEQIAVERGTKKKHPFWWDFEEGTFQSHLKKVIDIRALMPLSQVIRKKHLLRALNKDQKTVLTMAMDSGFVDLGRGEERPLVPVILGEEFRGYQKAFEKIRKQFVDHDFQEISLEEALLPRVLEAIERKPLDYISKFSVSLSPDYRVHEAVSTICLNLLNSMRQNLPGVLEDVDSEFLHDFRIAVRRTRSLVSQLKKVLPEEVVLHFGREFKQLGTITGPVRDLDVYLLKKQEYSDMLPDQLLPGLEIFFEKLEQTRRQEVRKMRRALTSESVERLLEDWEEFHTAAPDGSWRGSEKACKKVAKKVIGKRFQRILHDGGLITKETEDEALHDLRIQGKKLRYLVEFFRSFFDEEKVEVFLKQMKKLQNNLGDFNDLSVQQDMLTDYQEALDGRSKKTLKVAAALGGLIAHLNDEQQKVRKKFEKTFGQFSNDATVTLFEQTFMLD